MPVLRPSGSDFTSLVKAAAQYVPAGTTAKVTKSGGGAMLAPATLGAVTRASEVAIRATPNSTVLYIPSIIPRPILYKGWQVSTLAGSGTPQFVNGTGTGASFYQPTGVALLPDGNIAVADYFNCRIRIVTPAGVVTFLAGGSSGFVDGTGSAAQFRFLQGVAVTLDGNIVVADTQSNAIRIVTYPGGVVTTLAGNITAGFADGTGTGASFDYPTALAVTLDGNIVVADQNNCRIRLVTYPGGVVTTLAGNGTQTSNDGTGTGAGFNYPGGIAILQNGNIVVSDARDIGSRIRIVTYPGGVVTTLAGSSQGSVDGIGVAAKFDHPGGVAVTPDGNIVVSDTWGHRIRLVTYPGGVVTTLAGNGSGTFANGTGISTSFKFPQALVVLPNGNIVVADKDNNRLRLLKYDYP